MSHRNYHGKMISPEDAVEKVHTKYAAEREIQQWRKQVETHEWMSRMEQAKADNYKKRIALATEKHGVDPNFKGW